MEHREGQRPGRRREPTGELIGPYAVIAQIATGQATTVHLAQKQGALGFYRLAAIKRLKPGFAKQPEWGQLLMEEARLSAGVHHVNVVDMIDVGAEPAYYLVMDYIEGADLEALLAKAGKERHPRYILPPVVDTLQGLHAVHAAIDEEGDSLEMVHQAPHARHILLGIDGTARITDFSQVSARGLVPSSLRSERLKPGYMAPEQIRAPDEVGPHTDLFIVGITLWEALTGERLFQAGTSELSNHAVLERHIPKPSEVGLKPPRCFDAICMRALARDPARRYASAELMARDLRDTAINEALYATSSELGQWVRALAGSALIERRRAIGADAPSLEIAIDAPDGEVTPGAARRPTVSYQFDVSDPARLSGITVSAPTREPSVEAGVPGREPTDDQSVTTPLEPADYAPIPSEPSRVSRARIVAVSGAPSMPRMPPAGFPTPAMTVLGASERVSRAPGQGFTTTAPGARRDSGHHSPGEYAFTRSGDERRPHVPWENGSVREPTGSIRTEGSMRPDRHPAPDDEIDAQPTQPTQPRSSLPEPSVQIAERDAGLTQRASASVQAGPAGIQDTQSDLEAAPSEIVSQPEAHGAVPTTGHAIALARLPERAPSVVPPVVVESARIAYQDGLSTREGEQHGHPDSLRPTSRAVLSEPADDDESHGSSGLGIVSLVLTGIIVVAGVVGVRQLLDQRERERNASLAASPPAEETVSTVEPPSAPASGADAPPAAKPSAPVSEASQAAPGAAGAKGAAPGASEDGRGGPTRSAASTPTAPTTAQPSGPRAPSASAPSAQPAPARAAAKLGAAAAAAPKRPAGRPPAQAGSPVARPNPAATPAGAQRPRVQTPAPSAAEPAAPAPSRLPSWQQDIAPERPIGGVFPRRAPAPAAPPASPAPARSSATGVPENPY